MMSAHTHIPVLLQETIEALAVQPGGRYIDCTLGAGGHAAAILDRSSPGGQLLGIDADPEAIRAARARLEAYSSSTLLVNENFVDLETICIKYDFSQCMVFYLTWDSLLFSSIAMVVALVFSMMHL